MAHSVCCVVFSTVPTKAFSVGSNDMTSLAPPYYVPGLRCPDVYSRLLALFITPALCVLTDLLGVARFACSLCGLLGGSVRCASGILRDG
jgi:hypothetical protein